MQSLRLLILIAAVFITVSLVHGQSRGVESAARTAFQFIVVGDPQPEEPPLEQPEVFKTILREIESLHPDCILITGDLIRGFTEDTTQLRLQWEGFQSAIRTIDIPILLTPGNHDVWNDVSEQEFRRRTGHLYYSRNFGAVHFVMLDSYEIGQMDKIGPVQLEWMKRDLEEHSDAEHIFIGVHAPLWAYGPSSNWMTEVHPLLKQYNIRAVFAGHWHIYQRSNVIDGVRYYISGGGGGMQAMSDMAGGEFFHYMNINVRDAVVRYAVIVPGNVHSDSVVTRESSARATTVRDELWSDPRMFFDESGKPQDRLSVQLHNPWADPVTGTFHWSVDRPVAAILPAQGSFSLSPGESKTIDFTVPFPQNLSMEMIRQARPALTLSVDVPQHQVPISVTKDLIVVRTAAAHKSVRSIVVDGDLQEWGDPWAIRLDDRSMVTLVPERWQGPSESSGSFSIIYNDSLMFFAGTVTDQHLLHAARKEEPYQADAVSLYLDLRDSTDFQKRFAFKDVVLLVFAPPSSVGDSAYWRTVYPYGTQVPGVAYASQRIAGGYTIEVSIPLSQLKNVPSTKKEIGLDICIDNLQENGNRTRMLWNGIWANFMYANRYGRLRLK